MDASANGTLSKFFAAVCANNANETIELLRNKLVEVDARDPTTNDQTALHIAAQKGHYELARILVDEYNATVNIEDRNGNIPLQIATDWYRMKIVKFLLQRDSKMREYAAHCLNDEAVEELFRAADSKNTKKILELLKDEKVDVNSLDKSDDNRSILHIAAADGDEDLVRILVDEYGANIRCENDIGETAKHLAADNGHRNIVKFFIDKGYKDPRPCYDTDEDASSKVEMPISVESK